RASGGLAVGNWADLLALGDMGPDGIGRQGDLLLDTWIFARDDRAVSDVWAAGRHVVRGGRHIRRDEIVAGYAAAMRRLRDGL
ncbi:formimidoylglutamate deiminase, partial [Rhodovulum sulfidophilum]|nr:formimidoylglutamate deiminase [Rhodovulum sulfidophilum]